MGVDPRTRGEQTVLDTLVAHVVTYGCMANRPKLTRKHPAWETVERQGT